MIPELVLDYQIADDLESRDNLPSNVDFVQWLSTALQHIEYKKPLELSIRIVSENESQTLNSTYRGKDKATNVLSFPSEVPDFVPSNHVGDLAICAAIVEHEARMQEKVLWQNWAHMCIHGLLHLLGYDHINEHDAECMEAAEVAILAKLNIDNPYLLK